MTDSATKNETHIMKDKAGLNDRAEPENIGRGQRTAGRNHAKMSDVDEPLEQGKDFRSRRAHRKSRLGCLRCKQARRKCDELKPRCTRCISRGADCKYPEPLEASLNALWIGDRERTDDDFWGEVNAYDQSTTHMPNGVTRPAASATSSVLTSPSDPPNFDTNEFESSLPVARALDQRETELLSHYLSHTTRAFAFGIDDLWALQIGFPTLALRSDLIMKSMLALAAMCKCNHILVSNMEGRPKDTPVDEEVVVEAKELLSLADNYHAKSLLRTKAEVSAGTSLEFALANAPLMFLYALASQSIRLQLVEQHRLSGSQQAIPPEITPSHSQWLSLVRASHGAQAGLTMASSRRKGSQTTDIASRGVIDSSPPPQGNVSTSHATLSADETPSSRRSKEMLLPIVTATYPGALAGVRERAMAIQLEASSQAGLEYGGSDTQQEAIKACLVALDLLETTAMKVCGHSSSNSSSPANSTPFTKQQEQLPSWLQAYLARATSKISSQAPHRIVTSFINLAPPPFLAIVQQVFVGLPVLREVAPPRREPLSLAERLAMDIMAHWMVFVMLLDDIWWFGDIGAWEIWRISAVMKSEGWAGEEWWPDSMLRIRDQVERHRV